ILRHRLSDVPGLRPIGRLEELRLPRLRQRLIPADSDRMPILLGRRSLHTPSEGDSLHLRFLVATPTLSRTLRNRTALTHQLIHLRHPGSNGEEHPKAHKPHTTLASPPKPHGLENLPAPHLEALKLVQTRNR